MHGSAACVATRRSLRIFLVARLVPVAKLCGVQLAVQTQSWLPVFVAFASAKLNQGVSIAFGMGQVQELHGARAAWRIAGGTCSLAMLAWSAPRTRHCLACFAGVAMVCV